jgi:hypothetical protein
VKCISGTKRVSVRIGPLVKDEDMVGSAMKKDFYEQKKGPLFLNALRGGGPDMLKPVQSDTSAYKH